MTGTVTESGTQEWGTRVSIKCSLGVENERTVTEQDHSLM